MKLNKSIENSDIEALLNDLSEDNSIENYRKLYETLADRKVYMPLNENSLPTNTTITVNKSDQAKAKTVLFFNNKPCLVVTTSDNSPVIEEYYAIIYWIEALEMVLRIDELYGILIQGNTSWVAFDIERIIYILQRYKMN